MSAQAVQLGPDAVCDLAGVPFGLTHFEYRLMLRLGDRTTTDDGSGRVEQSQVRKLRINFTAQRQADVSYHAAPTDLTTVSTPGGLGFADDFWFNGRGDGANRLSGVFKTETFSGAGGVAQSQPQTITVEAESDGDFWLDQE